jgi:hypothetical protein
MGEVADFWDFHDRAVLDNLTLDRALLFECKVRAIGDSSESRRPRSFSNGHFQDDEVVQVFLMDPIKRSA